MTSVAWDRWEDVNTHTACTQLAITTCAAYAHAVRTKTHACSSTSVAWDRWEDVCTHTACTQLAHTTCAGYAHFVPTKTHACT